MPQSGHPEGHHSSSANSLGGSLLAFGLVASGSVAANTWGLGNELPATADDVTVFLAKLVLAGLASWWIVNVAAWVWALRSGLTITRFTLPGSRPIAKILLAASLSTACVAEGSTTPSMELVEAATASSGSTTTTTTEPTSTAPPTTTAPTTTAPTTTAPTTTAPTTAPENPGDLPNLPSQVPAPPVADAVEAIADHDVIVSDGDNLWSLAEEALTASGVEKPSCELVAKYWRLVVSSNQVRSGNPNIIVPGEAITMPAFELAA